MSSSSAPPRRDVSGRRGYTEAAIRVKLGETGVTGSWMPMPHRLAVRCPDCGGEARFEFARGTAVGRAALPYFKASRNFTLSREFQNGYLWYALYYPGLAAGLDTLEDLPEGHTPQDWGAPRYHVRHHFIRDRGALACLSCGARRKHVLDWPADAWFCFEHKGRLIWAFDRPMAVALRDHIRATDRSARGRYRFHKLPRSVVSASARPQVLRKLDRLLREGQGRGGRKRGIGS